jgi:hypothetical protein
VNIFRQFSSDNVPCYLVVLNSNIGTIISINMKESVTKNFKSEILHGFLASAIGKAIYLFASGIIAALAALFYITREKTITVPSWIVALSVTLIVVILAVSLIFYFRSSFNLARKLSSEAFGTAARAAKHIRILNTFIPNISDIADDIVAALNHGADVQVLILHPKCQEVAYRAETLQKDLDWVENQIVENLDELYRNVLLKTSNPQRLHVRIFKSWPPFAMYATNKKMMIGYYWAGELAIKKPQLILSSRHESFLTFQNQFDAIWLGRDSHDLTLENWRTKIDHVQ